MVTVGDVSVARRHSLSAAGGGHGSGCGLSLSSQDPDDVVESLLYVYAILGRRLDELAAQLACESMALLGGYLTLGDPIALVPHKHYRDGRRRAGGGDGRAGIGGRRCCRLFDPLDLVVKSLDSREGRPGRDAVDEDEAFAVSNPLISQGGILFLAGRIQHFQHAGLIIYDNLLTVGILNRRVVLSLQVSPLIASHGHANVYRAGVQARC